MSSKRRRNKTLPPGIDELPSGEHRARITDANGSRRMYVGTLADAVRWREQQHAARARARAGLEEPPEADGDMTLGDLITLFNRQAAFAYQSEVAQYFLRRWKEWLGRRRLSSLRDRDIITWRDERIADGVAAATIDRELSALKGIYRWAMRTRRMRISNPATGITGSTGVGARIQPAPRRPAPGAVDRTRAAILEHLEEETSARVIQIYDLARWTGMRRGEILALRWRDLHLDDDTDPYLIVEQRRDGATKSQTRAMPLIRQAGELLRQMLTAKSANAADTDRIWMVEPRSISQAIRRACDRAGIPADERATMHPQRHLFVSLAREGGMPDAALREVIGHRDPIALRGYTRIDREVAGRLLREALRT